MILTGQQERNLGILKIFNKNKSLTIKDLAKVLGIQPFSDYLGRSLNLAVADLVYDEFLKKNAFTRKYAITAKGQKELESLEYNLLLVADLPDIQIVAETNLEDDLSDDDDLSDFELALNSVLKKEPGSSSVFGSGRAVREPKSVFIPAPEPVKIEMPAVPMMGPKTSRPTQVADFDNSKQREGWEYFQARYQENAGTTLENLVKMVFAQQARIINLENKVASQETALAHYQKIAAWLKEIPIG